MQSFFKARPTRGPRAGLPAWGGVTLALSASVWVLSLAGCPGQLDFTPLLPDAGFVNPPTLDAGPPPTPPPPPMADAAPLPPPRMDAAAMRDVGSRPDVGAPPPDGPVASESWCRDSNEVTARILQPKCGACHSASTKAGALDLISSGVSARLIDVPAAAAACRNQALVTMTPQVGGHFFAKLERAVEGCGDRMPAGGLPALSATEVQCLKDWLSAVGTR
jgi:hypothetical protein